MNKNQFRKQLLDIRNNLKNKSTLSQQINLNVIDYINANTHFIVNQDDFCKNKTCHSGLDPESSSQNQEILNQVQDDYKKTQYSRIDYTKLRIASFVSLENEIDTQTINQHFNEFYLPIVHPILKHGLWFAKDCKKYYLNKYKIKEPVHCARDIVAAWELDIIIVPIVGFNEDKYRMGMGGGFYDYSLSFKKTYKSPLTIGIAFDEQQNNDIIIDEYDIKLDAIITPTRIL